MVGLVLTAIPSPHYMVVTKGGCDPLEVWDVIWVVRCDHHCQPTMGGKKVFGSQDLLVKKQAPFL